MSKFKVQIKSIFEQISQQVFNMNNVNDIKAYVIEFVNNKQIEDRDKQSIIKNINECKNVAATHRYICNSLLKFEGLSVNSYDKKEEVEIESI
mgnify:CR=1 FL=1